MCDGTMLEWNLSYIDIGSDTENVTANVHGWTDVYQELGL